MSLPYKSGTDPGATCNTPRPTSIRFAAFAAPANSVVFGKNQLVFQPPAVDLTAK